MAKRKDNWFTCPVCGEVVKADAPACPHCGADDETGWAEDAAYDGLDLPGDPDGPQTDRQKKAERKTTIIVAVLLALAILLLAIRGW